MKLSELLKLTPVRIDNLYTWFFDYNPIFQNLYITSIENDFKDGFGNRVKIHSYSTGKCYSDNRSREVDVVFLDNKPVLFYQIVGKDHEHTNVKVIDSNFIKEVYDNYIVQEDDPYDKITMDTDIDLEGYGMVYEIRDNKLYWDYE